MDRGGLSMSVNSYLQSLDSEIRVSDSEEERIDTSVTTIKLRLSSYFGYQTAMVGIKRFYKSMKKKQKLSA